MIRYLHSRRRPCWAAVVSFWGAAFSLAPAEVVFQTLASFSGTNGANPLAGLVRAADAQFYGTTRLGGAFNFGSVFQINPNGTLTTIISFAGTNGTYPKAPLVSGGPEGDLYGTTSAGGSNNLGTVFRLALNGNFSSLHSFQGPDGANPQAGLTPTSNGNFRGTTYYGGPNAWPAGYGSVFEITPTGQFIQLASFANDDGAAPYAALTSTSAGPWYGTTQVGGDFGVGTIYQLPPAGGLQVLLSFNFTNGAFPFSRLLAGADGALYGTTYSGGLSNLGTVFRLATNGVFTSLVSFVETNGARPFGGLVQAADGHLYGCTSQGGASGLGTIYQVTTNGILTTVFSFAGPNGSSPYGELVPDQAGFWYGTTAAGGPAGQGTVFRVQLPASEPLPAPVLGYFHPGDHGLHLTWNAVLGRSYQLQSQTNLTQQTWANWGPVIPATNTAMTLPVGPTPDPQRFYRLVLLP